jgi:surface carbohydrate biosynthesis protein
MKKLLYLPIETIAREFDARMLIANRALNRGYSVITGQKDNVFMTAKKIGEGIFFYKSHGDNNYPKNKTDKFKYITLDEEGLVFVDDEEYLLKAKPHELEHLDIVFTWGKYQKDLLLRENKDLDGKVIPVGNTRFDLLRPEFRILYEKAVRRIKNKWKNYIIINTRFAPGNFSRLYGCSYVESRKHQFEAFIGRKATGDEVDFLEREAAYYNELFQQYTEMLKVVSERFPDINFILRPHPSEDMTNWKEALKGLKNVNVIFEGTAVDWILGSILVIHTGCTTGIEAWALDKPVIAYNPNKKKGIEPPLPNRFGIIAKDIKTLCNLISKILDGQLTGKQRDQLDTAKPYIESITGDYSVKRFLDSLDELLRKEDPEDTYHSYIGSHESFKNAVKLRILKFLSRHQEAINRFAGTKISEFIYDRFKKYPGLFAGFKKFPGLGAGEIKNRLRAYDTILEKNPAKRYKVKRIATDTYFIKSNQ